MKSSCDNLVDNTHTFGKHPPPAYVMSYGVVKQWDKNGIKSQEEDTHTKYGHFYSTFLQSLSHMQTFHFNVIRVPHKLHMTYHRRISEQQADTKVAKETSQFLSDEKLREKLP